MTQQERHIDISDYYELVGEGPMVVFIHGSFSSSSAWQHYTHALASTYQCLTIKLPGHSSPGLSEIAEAKFNNDADFIEHLLSRLIEEPIKLIGHSYGAAVCIELALRNNLEIECMTLFEPVSVWALQNISDDKLKVKLENFLSQLHATYQFAPESVCQLVIDFWNNDVVFESLPEKVKTLMLPLVELNIRQWNWSINAWHDTGKLKQLLTPTTIACGTASHPIVHGIARYFAETMTNTQLAVLPNANHFLITTHMTDCLAIIEQDFQHALGTHWQGNNKHLPKPDRQFA